MPNDRKVMGNEQHGKAEFGAQPGKEIQQLRLDRNVEAGDDFVGDEDLWDGTQRARNVDALTLPPDNWPGSRAARSAERPTSARSSMVLARRSSQLA